MRRKICCCLPLLLALSAVSAWPQAGDPTSEAVKSASSEDLMLTPPPVSGQQYPVALASEERRNSLQYGVVLSSGYSDNVLGLSNGHSASDINYSVWPTIGLYTSTSRLHWDMTYSPGFTFYQRTDARNQADHSANLGLQYRLSPHVTFSVQDTFQKSSSIFDSPNPSIGPVFAGPQGPNNSIVAPLADQLRNFGTVGITFQYSRSDMIGAGGAFSNLYYPNKAQVTGLWDSSSQSGSAFYSHRFSMRHYLGATYQHQRLVSYLGSADAKTETDSVSLFYTVYPMQRLSISFFGGPQYSDTAQPPIESLRFAAFSSRGWSSTGGASMSWSGQFVSAAVSYSHAISGGGGLIGAARLDNANASFRLQFTPSTTASIGGLYANNQLIGYSAGQTNGHTLSGTVAMQHRMGEHFSLELGYERLHQTYSVPALLGMPDTNREFISISYSFARPLGR